MSYLRLGPFLVAVLLALSAVLAACGGGSAVKSTENRSNSIPPAGGAGKGGGALAPSFSVSTGAGSIFSLDEHNGEVVLLYFSFPG